MIDGYLHGGVMKNGVFYPDDPDLWRRTTHSINGRISISIKLARYQSSPATRNYYWGVVVKGFADHYGYEKDEAHEILKPIMFPHLDERLASMSDGALPNDEVWEGINRAVRYMANDGLSIPPPGKFDSEMMFNLPYKEVYD